MNIEKFSNKLGSSKTFVVRTKKNQENGPKDANDALLKGEDLKKYINES
jgi:hypothetical protein